MNLNYRSCRTSIPRKMRGNDKHDVIMRSKKSNGISPLFFLEAIKVYFSSVFLNSRFLQENISKLVIDCKRHWYSSDVTSHFQLIKKASGWLQAFTDTCTACRREDDVTQRFLFAGFRLLCRAHANQQAHLSSLHGQP